MCAPWYTAILEAYPQADSSTMTPYTYTPNSLINIAFLRAEPYR